MQHVISIRIPKELKEKMDCFDINWKEVLIKAIEERIKQIEAQRILTEMDKINEGLEVSKIPSWKIIREDRDASH